MATNKKSEGDTLTYTAGGSITSGQLLSLTALVGIAHEAAENGDDITALLRGIFDVPCASTQSFAQFAKAYHDGTAGVNATTSGVYAGIVMEAVAATTLVAPVNINIGGGA